MHVDLDAFYAAIEQRDHPQWRGLPVVVGAEPGKRGVVATCSYEARRYGVHSAMPISEAARRLPPETVYVRPRMDDYARVSRQVMGVLETASRRSSSRSRSTRRIWMSPGWSASWVRPRSSASGPRRRSGRRSASPPRSGSARTGSSPSWRPIPTSPMGSRWCRARVCRRSSTPCRSRCCAGWASRPQPRLQRLGLKTVGDVRRLSLEALRRQLGARAGTEVHLQARGIADDRVYPASERKSISKETTFAEDVTDPAVLRDTLRWAAQEVGFLARQEGRKGAVVTLKIRFRPFETHTRSRTLPARTASDSELFRDGLVPVRGGALGGEAGAADRSGPVRLGRGGRCPG